MPRVGRRTAYLWGMGGMCLILYLIGGLSAAPDTSRIGITQAVLTLIWSCMFHLSVGQLGWSIPAEIGSTRLRQKTICLGRNAYTVASIVAWVAQPYFMNPSALNLKGYTGFIWGSTALMVLIWGWFRLPETKDRTFDELDVLFAKNIAARRFKASPIEMPGTYYHSIEGCSAG
jgi:MFS transporter, SP family, general alpha glucoside:H+ symporter